MSKSVSGGSEADKEDQYMRLRVSSKNCVCTTAELNVQSGPNPKPPALENSNHLGIYLLEFIRLV